MRISSLRLNDCLCCWHFINLLFKLSSGTQAGSSLFPSVIAGFLFAQTSCLIFLYHRHVAQLVEQRAKAKTSHACGSLSNVFLQLGHLNPRVVGSSPTVSISNFQNFPKKQKEGECLSAIVRMGFFTFYGTKERVERLV